MKWESLYEMAQNYISDINELGDILDEYNTFSICDSSKSMFAYSPKNWRTEVRRFAIDNCTGHFNEMRMGFEII